MGKRWVIYSAVISFLISGCSAGTWKFEETNDYFTLFNKDSDYTQGVRLQHDTEDLSWAVGQRIYTPVHKKLDPPIEDERPYAGYLYGEVNKMIPHDNENTLFYGAELGVLGSGSYGKEAQCGVHALLGQACPAGWSHQLKNEPGVTIRGGSINRVPVDFWILQGENYRAVTVEAGNISTAIHVDSLVKWGRGVLYYYAGPTVHIVGRNAFLDGNTFVNSPSVDSKWLWAEMKGGIGAKLGKYSVSWFIAATTPQFSEQGASYNYGGISIEWIN